MIIHGKQQILPPNMIIGRTQIQGACIGREVVFGSLWLSASAQAAILGAFGQRDGMAVINATNAYLNGIAAQGQAGKAKAQALAGFINEDPMMVCSLGLEVEGVTMPIRWLVGDANAYIDTEYKPNNNTKVRCIYKINSGGCKVAYGITDQTPSATQAWGMLKIYDNPNRYGFGYASGTTIDANFGSTYGQVYELVQDKNELYLDGVKQLTMPASTWQALNTLWLYGRNGGSAFFSDDSKAVFEIWDGATKFANMIPCKHNGQNGMYDIERMRWFGNANSQGSFTIPDISYTPSTP